MKDAVNAPVILQRNAVDGAQAKLQPRCDKTAALVSNRTLENRSLIQRNEQSPGVEGRLANQVLAASDCHPCASKNNKAGPHCKFGGAAALEQSVKVASSNIGADASAALPYAGVGGSPKFGAA